MSDFSTPGARPGVVREELAFDVLFVGGGPANLAALWRLLDLLEVHRRRPGARALDGLNIALIEKGEAFGSHSFSGAILDPCSLQELCPDYRQRGFPLEGEVREEEVWVFNAERGGFRLPLLPPFLRNRGHHMVSLSRVVSWMAEQLEARRIPGVEVTLLPGFAGMKILWEEGRVVGVQTADRGVDPEGSPKANFEPGNELRAKVTVFGEGARGHLARELEEVLGLQGEAINPQVFETGVKETWELPPGQVPPGFVLHSTGWPLGVGESGGSFVYAMGRDRLALGYVLSLDTRDPFADAHWALQKFKQHPRIAELLRGGRVVEYGAKALAIGGYHSMPRLAFPGGMILGDGAQMVNAARLKGIHLAMKAGLCAAETLFDALLEEDFGEASLMRYSAAFHESWAGEELREARNTHAALVLGLTPLAALRLGCGLLAHGWLPCDPMRVEADAACTDTTEAYYNKAGLHRDAMDPGLRFDGRRTLSKLEDLHLAGVRHDEQQPAHLKILKGDELCAACFGTRGAPCTVFCPAQVYEMHPDGEGRVSRVEIAFSNCVHCKTCDIKCPEQNVIWTPPEGGGGPGYTLS